MSAPAGESNAPLPPALPVSAPRPTLQRLGAGQTAVVTLDDVWGDLSAVVDAAAALAPFPPAENHYPGVRRMITAAEGDAYAYIEQLLERAAPYIGGAYDVDEFELVEASFSMVTMRAEALSSVQRAPHFDTLEDKYFAVMHYLRATAGTAFYRHRTTGIERMTDGNLESFIAHAARENCNLPPEYITGANAYYEQIGAVEGLADRLIIYPGNLLHSGNITSDVPLSSDPRAGRLTTNIFIRAVG